MRFLPFPHGFGMDFGRFGEGSGGVLEVVFHTIIKKTIFLKIAFSLEKTNKFKGLGYEKSMEKQ